MYVVPNLFLFIKSLDKEWVCLLFGKVYYSCSGYIPGSVCEWVDESVYVWSEEFCGKVVWECDGILTLRQGVDDHLSCIGLLRFHDVKPIQTQRECDVPLGCVCQGHILMFRIRFKSSSLCPSFFSLSTLFSAFSFPHHHTITCWFNFSVAFLRCPSSESSPVRW